VYFTDVVRRLIGGGTGRRRPGKGSGKGEGMAEENHADEGVRQSTRSHDSYCKGMSPCSDSNSPAIGPRAKSTKRLAIGLGL
jgi:hypothetical protein